MKPAKLYYWQCSVTTPAGEVKSEIFSFGSAFFSGVWSLDTVANKKGLIDYQTAGGANINKDYRKSWYNWSGASYSYTQGDRFYTNDTINVADVLTEGEDIERINIHNSSKIQLYGSGEDEYINAEFIYDEEEGSAIIEEYENGSVHIFPVVNVGYNRSFQKNVLIMMKENGLMLIYSKKER